MSSISAIPDDSASAPLWEGYRAAEIRLPWCLECERAHLPPAPVCPHCLSDALEWRTASGIGSVATWAVMQARYFADFEPPYLVVQVELDEGPRMPAAMSMLHREVVRIGLPVSATFPASPGGTVMPFFVPFVAPISISPDTPDPADAPNVTDTTKSLANRQL